MAMPMPMPMPMEVESEDYLNETRYHRWVERRGRPLPYYVPPPTTTDAPKWRGEAKIFFDSYGPNPAYGIAERARYIAYSFEIRKRRLGYFSSDDEDEDEDEDERIEQRVRWLKGLLDELEEYDGESIDVATLLHSDGYLFYFLSDMFSNEHACIRAKAAELITSMVKNHPTSQQLLIDAHGIQLLLRNFTTDPTQLQGPNLLVQYPH